MLHTVGAGDCLTSLADHYGFFWQTIWNHPDNSALRLRRHDPNILAPGDVVFIPEKREKMVPAQTTMTHTFRMRGVPAKLKLTLRVDGKPIANRPWTLRAAGCTETGTTGADGRLVANLPPQARTGTLDVDLGDGKRTYKLRFGGVEPVDTIGGVQHRLRNLGFAVPASGLMDDSTKEALAAFQASQRLNRSGELDNATRAALAAIHDDHPENL